MEGLYVAAWEAPLRAPEGRLREGLAKALIACAIRLAPSLRISHAPVAATA